MMIKFFTSRIKSLQFALEGLKHVFNTQPNFRIHLVSAVIHFFLGASFGISTSEWGILVLSLGGVLAAESFNTAIECLTDLVSPQIHPYAKITKDVSAAGVLLVGIASGIVSALIFIPKIISL